MKRTKALALLTILTLCLNLSFTKPILPPQENPAMREMEVDYFLDNYDKPKNEIWICYFWATWCVNCVRTHGVLKQLDNEIRNQHVRLVSLSLDNSKKKWHKFMIDNPATWEQMWATDMRFDRKFRKKFGDIEKLPELFIINRNGNISRVRYLNQLKSELQKVIEGG